MSVKPLIEVKNIDCKYRGETIIKDLSLHANKGSLVCLLGPSGCGKTTVLRAIAGFEPVYNGKIKIDEKVVSRPGFTEAPEKRQLGMVFQDYALFPHMTVSENLAYPLEVRKRPKIEIKDRVAKALEMVELQGFGGRLSGMFSNDFLKAIFAEHFTGGILAFPDAVRADQYYLPGSDPALKRLVRGFFRYAQRQAAAGELVKFSGIGVKDQGRLMPGINPVDGCIFAIDLA